MEQYTESGNLISFSYVPKFETGECLIHILRKQGVDLPSEVEESIKDLDFGAFCNKEVKIGILKAEYFDGKICGENAIASAGLGLGLKIARPEIVILAYCKILQDVQLRMLFNYLPAVISPEVTDVLKDPVCFDIDCITFDALLVLNEDVITSVRPNEGYIFEIAEEAEPAIN